MKWWLFIAGLIFVGTFITKVFGAFSLDGAIAYVAWGVVWFNCSALLAKVMKEGI